MKNKLLEKFLKKNGFTYKYDYYPVPTKKNKSYMYIKEIKTLIYIRTKIDRHLFNDLTINGYYVLIYTEDEIITGAPIYDIKRMANVKNM